MSSLIKKFRIKSFKEESPIIELRNLTISYGNRQIVEKLNLNIQKSEICGLLGPNGAGKSSIYHSILGLVKPTFGKIFINGTDVTDIPTHKRCSEFAISWVPQYGGSWSDLTVYDNLMAIAELYIKNKDERITKINNLIRKFELENVIKLKSKYLSGGQVRKLTLAMAMVKNTKILILDEPFAALDPQSVRMIQQIIVSLQMFEKISISISDHSSRDLLSCVDKAMILSEGKIVARGTPQELVRNTRAIEAYFGEGFKF
tara:strand:- start:1284 stop:2060 length:777 start_codon:yes stop_codon:yes gene_type:complete